MSLLLGAGCGRQDDTLARAAPRAWAVPFPASREAKASTLLELDGALAESVSSDAVVQGDHLTLNAAGNPGFAVYRFASGPHSLNSMSVDFVSINTYEVWIGLPDYTTGRWVFDGPYWRQPSISIPLVNDYISPAGNTYVAILAPPGNMAEISRVRLDTENEPPLPVLTADVLTGKPPLQVHFDASGSSDPEGSSLEYYWDLDGDGALETSGSPRQTLNCPGAGKYVVTVFVRDGLGVSASAALTIDCNFAPTPVAAEADVAGWLDVALIGGKPAVLYQLGYQLTYAYALDAAATSWSVGTTVPHMTQGYLLELDAKPACIGADDNFGLSVFHADDELGTYWSELPVPIAAGAFAYSPPVLVDGNPAVAYCSSPVGKHDVSFIRATDAGGSAWGAPVVLGSMDDFEGFPQTPHLVALPDGPACTYIRSNFSVPDQLCFVRAQDQSGASWGTASVLVEDPLWIQHDLANVGGVPAVVYSLNAQTWFMRAADSSGDAWLPGSEVPDPNLSDGLDLTVFGGRPVILSGFHFIRSTDAAGSGWLPPMLLNDPYEEFSRLVDYNGQPGCVYSTAVTEDTHRLHWISGF